MLRCFACKGSRNRAKNKTNGLFFFQPRRMEHSPPDGSRVGQRPSPAWVLVLEERAGSRWKWSAGRWKMVSQQWIMGSIRCVAADTQQWISCHTTVEQPSHNNGTTVTDVDTILLRAFKYVKRGIANFYQFSRVTDVQEGKKLSDNNFGTQTGVNFLSRHLFYS